MNAPGAWLDPLEDLNAYRMEVKRHVTLSGDTPNNLQLRTILLTVGSLILRGTLHVFSSVVRIRIFFAACFSDGSIDNRPCQVLVRGAL